ncbi:Bro-N domain-containing protein [Thalassospira sp.]|uniref:BRO-N domain-containing protein n=1 Tax=Thalassospira sp. TaxID=1912094 RepID=UPI003AA80431
MSDHGRGRNLPAILKFHDTELTVIDRDGTEWISSPDLARALGYKRSDEISRIYRRNADEFTAHMTQTANLALRGQIAARPVRLYSLRGAHLVALFATTDTAKEFRRWVLDVLEGLEKPALAPAPVVRSRVLTRTDHRLINQRAQQILNQHFPDIRTDLAKQAQAALDAGQVPDIAALDVVDPHYFSRAPHYAPFKNGMGIVRVEGRFVVFDASDWRGCAGAKAVAVAVDDGRLMLADIADPLAGQGWFDRCMRAAPRPGSLLHPVVVVIGRVVWEEGA